MIRYRIGVLIVITTILYSCSQMPIPTINPLTSPVRISSTTENSTVATNATMYSSATLSLRPQLTITNSPSPTVFKVTSTPSLPDESINYQCLQIASNIPANANSEGILVTTGYGESSETDFLDMQNQTKIVLPKSEGTSLLSFKVSPNGKWLAYLVFSRIIGKSQLIVAGSDGQSIQILPWQEDWYLIAGWLDNDHLLISKRPSDLTFGSLVVINPFTKEKKELLPEFPDMVHPAITWINWGDFSFSGMIYNSTLTQVVYPRDETDFNVIELWNIQNNKEVMAIPTVLASSPEPKWSPDGKYLALVRYYFSSDIYNYENKSDLFILNPEGEIEQLTHFETYSESIIGFFNWSPDGRYIAFWFRAIPSQYSDDRLVVLDTITHSMTNYCIPGSFQGGSLTPIWSPDSRQLIIENFLGNNSRRVILVDIEHLFAAQIAKDVSPVGWMVSP